MASVNFPQSKHNSLYTFFFFFFRFFHTHFAYLGFFLFLHLAAFSISVIAKALTPWFVPGAWPVGSLQLTGQTLSWKQSGWRNVCTFLICFSSSFIVLFVLAGFVAVVWFLANKADVGESRAGVEMALSLSQGLADDSDGWSTSLCVPWSRRTGSLQGILTVMAGCRRGY